MRVLAGIHTVHRGKRVPGGTSGKLSHLNPPPSPPTQTLIGLYAQAPAREFGKLFTHATLTKCAIRPICSFIICTLLHGGPVFNQHHDASLPNE